MVKIMFPADKKHENELSKDKKKEAKQKGKEKAETGETASAGNVSPEAGQKPDSENVSYLIVSSRSRD